MSKSSAHQALTGLSLSERWHLLCFDLRLGSRYHTERRRFFERAHVVVAALSALLGSATVATLLADFQQGKTIAIVLTSIMTVGAAVDSVIGFSRKANDYATLARRFVELERDLLLTQPPSEEAYVKLQAGRRLIEADEPPAMPHLIRRCHRELMIADGYEENEWPAMHWSSRAFAQVLPRF